MAYLIRHFYKYRGLVKWYDRGLQNLWWEFDSLIPCSRNTEFTVFFLCRVAFHVIPYHIISYHILSSSFCKNLFSRYIFLFVSDDETAGSILSR